MKSHKIKHGGDYSAYGWDDTFRTFCGISSDGKYSEDIQLVGEHDNCTCAKCNRSYQKYYKILNEVTAKRSVL